MKQTLLIAAIICQAFGLYAQSEKTTLAVFPFMSILPENKERASQIHDMVIEILRNKPAIQLIDRSTDNQLKEQDYQLREQAMPASRLIQQGKTLGAKQLLIGTVSHVAVEKKSNTTTDFFTKKPVAGISYEANISFALQLTDVQTGKVIIQKAFNGSKDIGYLNPGSFTGSGSSQEEAIINAIRANRGQILSWLNEAYPPVLRIIKIEERDKKGYPETILVSGIDGTLTRGARIIVNEIEMVDAGGQQLKRQKVIGELKIKEKHGNMTICKITDGEKVLEEKMNAGIKMEFVIK
jgi:hypothetical protein